MRAKATNIEADAAKTKAVKTSAEPKRLKRKNSKRWTPDMRRARDQSAGIVPAPS